MAGFEAGLAALANPVAASTIVIGVGEAAAGNALVGNSPASAAVGGAKAAGETFSILNGVRRAKAAELVGNASIPANVLNAEGKLVGTRDIAVNQLLSPKSTIDVSTGLRMDRFMNTLNQTKAGSIPPPITVIPSVNGTPISRVTLDPTGLE